MRIGLSSLLASKRPITGTTSVLPFGFGDPAIICDLSHEQAMYVMQNGVPDSLRRELVRTATEFAWKPLEVGAVACSETVVVDASPHFEAGDIDSAPAGAGEASD
jgi:hypothetical protein